jgi:hypothetical protein
MPQVLRGSAALRGAFVGLLTVGSVSMPAPAVAAGNADAASTRPGELSKEQNRRLAALKLQAAGRDYNKSIDAIGKIEAMGPAVREELSALLRSLLVRNAAAIELAARAAATPQRTAPVEKRLKELRAEALANIEKLNKNDDSIAKAKGYYRKLLAATGRFSRTMEARSRLIDVAVRRLELLRVQGRVRAAGPDAAAGEKSNPSPIQRAEKALGVSLEAVAGLGELEKLPPLKDVFDYRLNRRTLAHNKQAARTMHPEEVRNAVMVNTYREALGLLRMEIDARLVQSARRHSKEMVELGYFSHTSPTEANKGFADRVRSAGYPSPGGENIAAGSPSGAHAFQQWFTSPPHHQNMVRGRFTAIGVGKWSKSWTQNFGSGRRLADADAATREAAKPKGKILPRHR